ncbi:MarR family transcriptional regulator [Bacterioplanes sanyensis]|uniref:MarR family transcriptional regulator n=1 Tax=Bacterioplanes sanyensis TaxID=1249553 RepID=A0A222FPC3_9GAMM|nr:MarR family transcriptional regulator [Bacterioplanes sanyensis]ASP40640.1 MarR family transcriptional regulator [Bacterioplanes sanyensis]
MTTPSNQTPANPAPSNPAPSDPALSDPAPGSNPLALDNQLCFALYSTSLAMTQMYKELLTPIGLTYPQYTIMLILWEQDGVTLKHIAERLGQKSGSLTPVIKRLETDGFIRRQRGKDDDRSLSIELTHAGQVLREQGLQVNQCILEACDLPLKNLVDLRDNLNELKQQLLK